ncbi:MAG TPA: hypothetical protein DD473_07570 [Planctomycetaceae bacterium]|nr:hypothetical protein [Planctomycetaceae bacterium]
MIVPAVLPYLSLLFTVHLIRIITRKKNDLVSKSLHHNHHLDSYCTQTANKAMKTNNNKSPKPSGTVEDFTGAVECLKTGTIQFDCESFRCCCMVPIQLVNLLRFVYRDNDYDGQAVVHISGNGLRKLTRTQ